MKKSTLVIGVIGADCHAVGNKVLDRVFTAHDFRVINLGVMVSQDEYIDAAIETGADAIVVSSITATAISTAWDCANAASNAVSAIFFFTLAATWWSVSMILPTSRPNSKRWASIASLPQATIWKTSAG